jgi:hypothetical protein
MIIEGTQLEFVFKEKDNIAEILQKLEDKKRILHWLIDGQGRTGIPIGCLCWIDRHWLVKHYNVEYSYFN